MTAAFATLLQPAVLRRLAARLLPLLLLRRRHAAAGCAAAAPRGAADAGRALVGRERVAVGGGAARWRRRGQRWRRQRRRRLQERRQHAARRRAARQQDARRLMHLLQCQIKSQGGRLVCVLVLVPGTTSSDTLQLAEAQHDKHRNILAADSACDKSYDVTNYMRPWRNSPKPQPRAAGSTDQERRIMNAEGGV